MTVTRTADELGLLGANTRDDYMRLVMRGTEPAIVSYVYNRMPWNLQGSAERVTRHLEAMAAARQTVCDCHERAQVDRPCPVCSRAASSAPDMDPACTECGGEGSIESDGFTPSRGHYSISEPCPKCTEADQPF